MEKQEKHLEFGQYKYVNNQLVNTYIHVHFLNSEFWSNNVIEFEDFADVNRRIDGRKLSLLATRQRSQ